jgi:hypothetical protein
MSTELICRVGTVKPDADMMVWDHRYHAMIRKDWAALDQKFDQVRVAFEQKATASVGTTITIPELTPISNQGRAGSCVANGCSDAFEILDGLEGTDTVEQLSRRWLYFVARQYTGDTRRDDGTYIRSALHQLKTIGTFEEKFFAYYDDPSHIVGDQSMPELDHYTMASNNRIKGFYRLEPTSPTFLQDLETAVRAYHPPIFGVEVGQPFVDYRGGGHVLNPPDAAIGRHCMIATGVRWVENVRSWLIRNSWSFGWGDGGHCWYSDDYMRTAQDVWVATKTLQAIR